MAYTSILKIIVFTMIEWRNVRRRLKILSFFYCWWNNRFQYLYKIIYIIYRFFFFWDGIMMKRPLSFYLSFNRQRHKSISQNYLLCHFMQSWAYINSHDDIILQKINNMKIISSGAHMARAKYLHDYSAMLTASNTNNIMNWNIVKLMS